MEKKLLFCLMVVCLIAGFTGTVFAGGQTEKGELEEGALDPPGPGFVEPGENIVIGGTFTLTGPVSHAGRMTLEGAQRAIEYVNNELGGILGHKVELKYYDDEFEESKITMLYERLITKDKVDMLVSPYTSPFLAACPVVDKHGMLLFCNAADSYVGNEQYGDTVVNMQMDDNWKGGMWWHDVADFFANFEEWNYKNEPRPKTVAVLNLNISYGHEVADSILPYLEDNGFEIVYHEFFEPHVGDWTPIVSKLKEIEPDIVFQPHYFEDCVTFIEKCHEMDYSAPYMIIEGMSWDPMSWTNPDMGGLNPSIAKRGFFGYSVYKEKYESETKDYLAEFTYEKHGHFPGNDHITGFMAVELLAKAANMAGSLDKEAMLDALKNNTFTLAGYPYRMNETGGNAAEFHWGVGQYIPEDIDNADTGPDDWYCVWPPQFADAEPFYPFPGWD
jgi:branched-chain amino acid transport system substrate-binding protein